MSLSLFRDELCRDGGGGFFNVFVGSAIFSFAFPALSFALSRILVIIFTKTPTISAVSCSICLSVTLSSIENNGPMEMKTPLSSR